MKDLIRNIRLIRNISRNIRGNSQIKKTTKLYKKTIHLLIEKENKFITTFIQNIFIKRKIK